ncbi:hypothetical protein ACJ6WF_48085 [Streptomyces sp. MMS24-I2-30]|uniref:hypothetical protein n=1 Tax=Streptomyces sp. MMS24-I2-30 TaxID=3351564 RepID=UPI00389688BA
MSGDTAGSREWRSMGGGMAKPKKKRGVRIPYVKDARGNRYDRSAIDVKPHPPYLEPLECFECGVDVHVRHGNADNPDSKSSHYVKNPGKDHGPRCPYDLERRGKELVATPGSTVVRKDGQWRLICPPLERPGTRGAGKTVPGPPARGRASGAGKAKPSKEAGQAIASARRIVRLLEAFDQDPDTVAEFAATVPGGRRNIAWPEFCRGRADVHQLAQDLIDGTAAPIPRAVWGPVSTADAVDGKTGRSYVVKYVARHPVLVQGRRLPLHVTLRSKNADWIGAASRSGQFLGYGYWTLLPKPEKVRGRIELRLWIEEPWQVARWDTDGTTQIFPPSRPFPVQTPSPGNTPPQPATPARASKTGNSSLGGRPADPAPPTAPEQDDFSVPPPPQSASETAGGPDAEAEQADAIEKVLPSTPSGRDDASVRLPPAADATQNTAATDAHAKAPDPPVPPMPAVPPKPSQPPQPSSPRLRRPLLADWLGRIRKRR